MSGQETKSRAGNRKSICLIMTSTLVLNAFFLAHLRSLADAYRVTVCVAGDDGTPSARIDERVEILLMPIKRRVHPVLDLWSLLWLLRLFLVRRFDAVWSVTPKAGLLAMSGAYLVRVPLRVHIFTGQVWATTGGARRRLYRFLDRMLVNCSTHVLADSRSQARFLEDEGVVTRGRLQVLASGSISGVDTQRFAKRPEVRRQLRQRLSIPPADFAYIYVGRLTAEKGFKELVLAFRELAAERNDVWLIVVGKDEEQMEPWCKQAMSGLTNGRQVVFVGLTPEPERYLNAADVLCLPSYREGFGTVVIEAAAAGLPAIGTRIYGLTDAIIDGETGILIPARSVEALHAAMTQVLADRTLLDRLGASAFERARREFSADTVTAAWRQFFDVHLAAGDASAER